MARNDRFIDDLVSIPSDDREALDRMSGRTASIMDEPRDLTRSDAWLEGYDQAQAETEDD